MTSSGAENHLPSENQCRLGKRWKSDSPGLKSEQDIQKHPTKSPWEEVKSIWQYVALHYHGWTELSSTICHIAPSSLPATVRWVYRSWFIGSQFERPLCIPPITCLPHPKVWSDELCPLIVSTLLSLTSVLPFVSTSLMPASSEGYGDTLIFHCLLSRVYIGTRIECERGMRKRCECSM